MNHCGDLDKKNIYVPNLQNIYECSVRQFLEGNYFFEMAEFGIKKTLKEDIIELIYDSCNAIASCLAFACESFLKALYIHENNIAGNKIDDIWENLKKPEKIDPTRNKKKVKGHDLDILIDNLSLDSKILLETRMLTIEMNKTEKYHQIDIFDILLKNEKIKKLNTMQTQKYYSWIEQHKRTFEKSRYGGQEYHKVNIEFLYHLAIQIRAVAQYKICPTDNQLFLLECNNIDNLPDELIDLYKVNRFYINEKLIKLITNNPEKKLELIKIVKDKSLMQFIKQIKIDFDFILRNLKYDELKIIAEYINNYNFEYNGEKTRIKKIAKEKGYIFKEGIEKLNNTKRLFTTNFIFECIVQKRKQNQKNITEEFLVSITESKPKTLKLKQ